MFCDFMEAKYSMVEYLVMSQDSFYVVIAKVTDNLQSFKRFFINFITFCNKKKSMLKNMHNSST